MSRKKPWFRLYSEIRQDRKLRRCSSDERWCWIVILCIASESPERGSLYLTQGVPCDFEDISDEAALPSETVEAAIHKFSAMNMMHQEDGVWVVTNFLERQYDKPSDLPENTKKRKQKSRQCHADVTTHITDNRQQTTETDLSSSCLTTTTTGQCPEADKGNGLNSNEPDSHPQAGVADAATKPTSQALIAELTNSYRTTEGIKHADGDYAFIGALYNRYGYAEVLNAISNLKMRVAVQEIREPLLYLKGILDKQQEREPPRNGGPPAKVDEQAQKKKDFIRSLYMNQK